MQVDIKFSCAATLNNRGSKSQKEVIFDLFSCFWTFHLFIDQQLTFQKNRFGPSH